MLPGWGQRQGEGAEKAQKPESGALYLSLEIVRVVVGVLGVHWLLFQAFAHVAGIPLAVAGY